jgi:ParB/RepB/Spo0J family partition protein
VGLRKEEMVEERHLPETFNVPLDQIEFSSGIFHEGTDNDSDLLESIDQSGVLEPIQLNQDWTISDGKKRVMAAKRLGLKSIPAQFARNVDPEATNQEFDIIRSGRQRASNEILSIAKLTQSSGLKQAEIATRLGRSPSYISRCVRAAHLILQAPELLREFNKSFLFQLTDNDDFDNLREPIEQGLLKTVADLRNFRRTRESSSRVRYITRGKKSESWSVVLKLDPSYDRQTLEDLFSYVAELKEELAAEAPLSRTKDN